MAGLRSAGMERWDLVVGASAAADVVLLVAAMFWPRPRLASPSFAIALWVAKTALLFGLVRDHFGWMALLYVDAVIVVPLGAVAWLLSHRRARGPEQLLAAVALALAPVGAYATF